jgi:hypothetical protein
MVNHEHTLKHAANISTRSGARRRMSPICVMLHSPFRRYAPTNLRSWHHFRGFACILHEGITLAQLKAGAASDMAMDRPVLAGLPCRVDVGAKTTAHWLLSGRDRTSATMVTM